MKVVITRAKEDAEGLVEKILNQPGNKLSEDDFIRLPCLEFLEPDDAFKSLDLALRQNHTYDWIFFLSKKAAEVFFNRLIDLGGNLFNVAPHIKIGCIGKSTKDYVENEIGFPVNFYPSVFNSDVFLEEFIEKEIKRASRDGKPTKKKFLLPRTSIANDDFKKVLEEHGQVVDLVTCYVSACPNADKGIVSEIEKALSNNEKLLVTLTSSEITRNFRKLLSESSSKLSSENTKLLSIGPKTSKTIKAEFPKLEALEPKEATMDSLASEVLKYDTW